MIAGLHKILSIVTVRRWLARGIATVLIGLIVMGFVADRWLFPLPADRLEKAHSYFVYSQDGHLLNAFASEDRFWRKPVGLDSISPTLEKVVLSCEDQWFYYHPGVNPVSLVTAAYDNIKAGKVVRGGSTITMQIARMMEPKSRTIGSKLVEILRAFQLEMHYSKAELLQIYFNLVPYGGNIEGVGAATHFYFGKQPARLSLSEAAILAAIPVSPNSFRPDANPEACRIRRDEILNRLLKNNIISQDEFDRATAEEIPARRLGRPFVAPQFCQSMIAGHAELTDIHTTIDYNLQTTVERLAYGHHLSLVEKGIHNLAVVVLDNRSGRLLAHVGSPDFEDTEHDGQVNGADALRSPGSALKPFVYALALDSGLITPASRLDDIPVSYSGYSPENYDEEYHGIVSARDALVRSLNVPAVNLTAKAGLKEYYDLLKNIGISSLTKKYYEYGLPLVLGAGEVSLRSLANAYATLARGGEYKPVIDIKDAEAVDGQSFLSPAACYIISNILSDLQRPELNNAWEFTADLPTIAWKTGTSYGRKDAWAIGYTPQYTVGVWSGNFSSESSPYIVGVDISAPLMLDIFRELTRGEDPRWFDAPPEVKGREVCTRSGMPPGETCPETTHDLFIQGVSPVAACDIHQRIFVDRNTGYRVSRACSYGRTIDTFIVEQWPARLSNWLLSQGVIAGIPPQDPGCSRVMISDAPVIRSPENDAVYRLRQDAPRDFQKVMFHASASLDAARLHWFLDNELFATCGPGGKVFYEPESGSHLLMCVDDLGRSSVVHFEIK